MYSCITYFSQHVTTICIVHRQRKNQQFPILLICIFPSFRIFFVGVKGRSMGLLQSIIMLAMMIIPIRSYVGTTTNVISFLNSGNLKLPSIPNRPNKLPFRWQMIRCAASSSSLCESSSSSSPSSISFLNGKTLVSVEECMNAYRIVHGLNADNLPQHDGDDSVGNNDNNNKSNDTSNAFIAENIGSDRNNGSKNDDDRIVFLDASWWHKGDFDGREL